MGNMGANLDGNRRKEEVVQPTPTKEDFFGNQIYNAIASNIDDNEMAKSEVDAPAKDAGKLKISTSSVLEANIGKIIDTIIKDEKFKEYFDELKASEEKISRLDQRGKILEAGKSELIILRQFNSYTPNLPICRTFSGKETSNKGGGYFICHAGKGIVIDPGYNFIEHLYRAGFTINDIDYILVTHAHDDHTAQIEGILSLLYRRNKDYEEIEKYHKIEILMNVGSYTKSAPLFDFKGKEKDYLKVTVMNCHQEYVLSNGADESDSIKLFTIRATHFEKLTFDYSLGFVIKLGVDKVLYFTGDTKWNTETFDTNRKFLEKNDISNVDVLISHIGSIKECEKKYDSSKSFEDNYNTGEVFYKNHLGLLGTVAMITGVNAATNIISEFGLEMDDQRVDLTKTIGDAMGLKNIFPADVNMRVDLSGDTIKIRCSRDGIYYDYSAIEVRRREDGCLVYLNKDDVSKVRKSELNDYIESTKVFDT